MEYSFPRYLLSKQTVDDRALNRTVLEALKSALSAYSFLSVVEVGAGIGTMLVRLLRWGLLPPTVEYTLVDEMDENICFARQWLPDWAVENGYQLEHTADGIRLSASKSAAQSVSINFVRADVFDFIRSDPPKSDLLIAHAFLDLLPMPESLPKLFSLIKPDGLAWLTINFDGVTTFEPSIRLPAPVVGQVSDSESARNIRFSVSKSAAQSALPISSIDATLERLYHQTMDTRPTGGDSQSGRHMFGHLKQAGGEILAAGASDWVVYPLKGQYPADEAYFLHFILHFFEISLANHPDLDPALFSRWLAARRAQIERAELIYIAHQIDFLVAPVP